MNDRPPAMGMHWDPSKETAQITAQPTPSGGGSAGGGALQVIGWILFCVGACAIIWGFMMDASVETAGGYGGIDLPSRINNTGLLNDKLMLVVAGVGALVSGSIFAARG